MRISTNTIYESGGARISDLQVGLNRTQQQIASGRRILNPSDDPIGAARATRVLPDQLACWCGAIAACKCAKRPTTAMAMLSVAEA